MSEAHAALGHLVRKLERLAALGDEDKASLLDLPIDIERVPRSFEVVREGEAPDTCCLLLEGFACRSKSLASGVQQIVSFHVRGDLLDVQHLLLPQADHTLSTISRAALGWIPKSALYDLAWQRPAIGMALWRDSLVDASVFREWVLNVGRRDARRRIAHMLCEFLSRCLAAGLGSVEEVAIPMTQGIIADATGLTPIHVNRTMRKLVAEGALAGRGKELRVRDWQTLAAIAEFDANYLHPTT